MRQNYWKYLTSQELCDGAIKKGNQKLNCIYVFRVSNYTEF